jgi:hypothetical protein
MFVLGGVVLLLGMAFGLTEKHPPPPPVTKAIGCSCSSLASGVPSWQNTYVYFAIKDLLISK